MKKLKEKRHQLSYFELRSSLSVHLWSAMLIPPEQKRQVLVPHDQRKLKFLHKTPEALWHFFYWFQVKRLPHMSHTLFFSSLCWRLCVQTLWGSLFSYLQSGYLNFFLLWLLPPATKLGQGYVFTGVCNSLNRGTLPQCMLAYSPPEGDPPGPGTPPAQSMLGDTGMQSCLSVALHVTGMQL